VRKALATRYTRYAITCAELDNEYSSDESQASLSANVTTEREYPYDANDYSFITSNNDSAANPRIEQTDV